MNNLTAKRIISNFLAENFSQFKIGKRLSDFAHTFLIIANRKEYIIKLVEYQNVISKIKHSRQHVKNLIKLSRIINSKEEIKTISVCKYRLNDKYSIILMPKEKKSKLKINKKTDFKALGRAIANFHRSGQGFKFMTLPWNHLLPHFIQALKKYGRWEKVNVFFKENARIVNSKKHVVCHNDIHDGNIFISGKKILFLDIDDIALSTPFNDLGMVIANFSNSRDTNIYLQNAIKGLLSGYGLSSSKKSIRMVLLFALRKLYLTEAYYFFLLSKGKVSGTFIQEIQSREINLNQLYKDYL